MRSSGWAPIAGWCAATAASVALASAAILPVLRTTEPADAAVAPIPAPTTSFPAALPSAGTPAPPSGSTAAPPSGAATPSRDPATRPTTRPPRTVTASPVVEDGWTVTTGAGGLRTYVRSFRVEGGQAVIRMTSAGVVELITATPADGFSVQQVQDSPGNLAVYFNETNHSFIIHATWWDDRPFAQVSEIGQ